MGMVRVLLTPGCWLQNERYSPALDARLRTLLESEKFTKITNHTACIGNLVLWTANHPYASFTPEIGPKCRPSRATILDAADKLHAQIFSPAGA